jgi:hypothetical protein
VNSGIHRLDICQKVLALENRFIPQSDDPFSKKIASSVETATKQVEF